MLLGLWRDKQTHRRRGLSTFHGIRAVGKSKEMGLLFYFSMCICVRVHVCTCVCRCMCVCPWRPEDNLGCCSPEITTLVFEMGVTISHWELGLPMNSRDPPVSISSALGLQVHATSPGFIIGSGAQTQVLMLVCSKHYTD